MMRLPSPIEGFAAEAAGRFQAVIDRSWPRNSSNVWELISNTDDHFYLKQHSSPLYHAREVSAYRHWTAELGPGRAPVLLAADPDLRTMVVTALPGHLVAPRELDRDLPVTQPQLAHLLPQGTLLGSQAGLRVGHAVHFRGLVRRVLAAGVTANSSRTDHDLAGRTHRARASQAALIGDRSRGWPRIPKAISSGLAPLAGRARTSGADSPRGPHSAGGDSRRAVVSPTWRVRKR